MKTKDIQELYQIKLHSMDTILHQISLMDQVENEQELSEIIHSLLQAIGNYTGADRVYVFDWETDQKDSLSNTFEWCADGVAPEIDNLQAIPVSSMPNWVKRFENKYTPIPAEYHWLLLNFGGCYLAEPWIFTLKELEEAYPIFQEAYEDYMSEYDHGPTFPIGGLGDGSIVFIDLESGRVRGYNCDYADLEEIAENFSSLLLGLVEQALERGNLCKEL